MGTYYFNDDLKPFLTVYAEEFKMSGPHGKLLKGWALIRDPDVGNLTVEYPAPANLYLGRSTDDTRLY